MQSFQVTARWWKMCKTLPS